MHAPCARDVKQKSQIKTGRLTLRNKKFLEHVVRRRTSEPRYKQTDSWTAPLRRAQVWARIRPRCTKQALLQWTAIGLCGCAAAKTARGCALSGWPLRCPALLLKQYRPPYCEPI